ncbi:MAG: hypothetical protein ABI112_17155 [Terracoccus sp.]
MSAPFRILFVCTGNICRSPAAERLLAARVPPRAAVTVESVGTDAVVGEPISPPMAGLLTAAGANASDFAARLATTGLLENADLVVGLTTRILTDRARSRTPVAFRPSANPSTPSRESFTCRDSRLEALSPTLDQRGHRRPTMRP